MRIDIEELRTIRERIKEINRTPLNEIEYHYNGELVDVSDELIDEWKFMGLSNFYFDRDMLEGNVIDTHDIEW